MKNGDKVTKNPETWINSSFDLSGAGVGVGVVMEDIGDGFFEIKWTNCESCSHESELNLTQVQ